MSNRPKSSRSRPTAPATPFRAITGASNPFRGTPNVPALQGAEAAAADQQADTAGQEMVIALAPAEAVSIPLDRLRAALICAGKNDTRYMLNAVFLQAEGSELRVVSSDGHRLLVCATALEKAPPAWLTAGVMIPRDRLDGIVAFLSKKRGPGEAPAECVIEYGIGHPKLTMRDSSGFASFGVVPFDGEYITYTKFIGKWSAQAMTGERAPLDTVALNPTYLAHAGKIAAQLDSKGVFPFIPSSTGASEASPTMFTFDGAPGVILYIMPQRVGIENAIKPETIRVIGKSGVKLSVAALRAHATRSLQAATKLRGDERKAMQEKSAAFTRRADELLADLKAPALPAPGEAVSAGEVETTAETAETVVESVDATHDKAA